MTRYEEDAFEEGDGLAILDAPRIQAPDVVTSRKNLLALDRFYPVIRDMCQEQLVGVDAEGLLETREGPQGPLTKRNERRVVHELRHRVITFSELGYVGKILEKLFELHVFAAINGERDACTIEQPNCVWELVAVDIKRVGHGTSVVKSREAAGEQYTEKELAVARANGRLGGIERHNRLVIEVVEHHQAKVELVFADVLGGEIIDPNDTIPGGFKNEMSDYAESRQINHMPRGLRLQRERAEDLVRSTYGLPPRRALVGGQRPRAPQVAGPTISREPEPDDRGVPRPPPAEVPKPPVEPLEVKVRKLAAEGVPPARIAVSARITKAQVDEILATPAE